MSQTISQLQSIVPDLVCALKALAVADDSQLQSRTKYVINLGIRIKSTYPPNIADAAFTIALLRFQRWSSNRRRLIEIHETMSEWERDK